MDTSTPRRYVAFSDHQLIAAGDLPDVAAAAKAFVGEHEHAPVLAFDAETSEPVEIDLRGTVAEVVARITSPADEPSAPRAPGRPKLGVVAREVTLLPRHWEWLAEQPGSASVTLRKLVEAARREGSGAEQRRRAQDAAYRFMVTMLGNEPGYEEATRALYASDAERFAQLSAKWPADLRDHARDLAARAFSAGES